VGKTKKGDKGVRGQRKTAVGENVLMKKIEPHAQERDPRQHAETRKRDTFRDDRARWDQKKMRGHISKEVEQS